MIKKLLKLRESGCSSGKKLEFYPSNPGLTPAQVNYHKKIKNQQVGL